ncbi:MAG: hypothetical protein WD187_04670 [Candidatus Woykebacteria bacterium]
MEKKAIYIGTTSLDFLDRYASGWNVFSTEDILIEGVIKKPANYFVTLGSGVQSDMLSLATTPSFTLPTTSQIYLAGRDVLRWGGTNNPYEIDLDHYGFTPDYTRAAVIVWKDPKSQPHHLSKNPDLIIHYPDHIREICEAVFSKRLP